MNGRDSAAFSKFSHLPQGLSEVIRSLNLRTKTITVVRHQETDMSRSEQQPGRRLVLKGALAAGAVVGAPGLAHAAGPSAAPGRAKAEPYRNPLVLQRADPHIVKHADGYYYFTATAPEYDRIVLRRSKTLQGLSTAAESVIWKKHTSGDMGAHNWAPEIHFIDGKWYVY